MDKEKYEELEDFVYQELFSNGKNDIVKVIVKVIDVENNSEAFEFNWENK